jgi:hypothetical protein
MAGNESLMRLMQMVTRESTQIIINGQNITGQDLVIKKTSDGGTVVMVDGVPAFADDVQINIEINGDVDSIELGAGKITCANVHNGIKTISGDVACEDVHGNITTTSGDVDSNDVAGNVTTVSGDVDAGVIAGNCSTISGDIST